MVRKTYSYRKRTRKSLQGGMKTPLLMKATSQYLKSNSGLSFKDQIKFENALAKSREVSSDITRDDLFKTLKRVKSARPRRNSVIADIAKSSWMSGGRRKSRAKKSRIRKRTKRQSSRYRKKSKK